MSQSLELNIKTTSDVPQAMDKAKTATVSFGKQVEDIQKKFSTAFKDIFLSFLGPMALLGVALNYISKLIEDNQRKREEANQAAIDGTNELMSAEDRYWARKRDREKKTEEKVQQSKMTREEVTEEFLSKDPRGKQLWKDIQEGKNAIKPFTASWRAIKDPEVQAAVQALLAEDAKKNPQLGAPTGEKKDFKGPEGFSNVIGVGPNPVMQAMNLQLEESQKQTALLEQIANKGGSGGVPVPFTESKQFPGYGDQM